MIKLLKLRRIVILILLLVFSFSLWFFNKADDNETIQFFPINKRVNFVDAGSDLQIVSRGNRYLITADSWSKTSEKSYLRQDLNLLFKNGSLINIDYPWKQYTDWITSRLEAPLSTDSKYTLLSYHHAEIHDDEIITSKQAVTADDLYVISFQNNWDAFKTPSNARQKEQQVILNELINKQRNSLLDKAVKESNINKENYDVYDLDKFSLGKERPKSIPIEKWERVLGGLWEGLYRSYVTKYPNEGLYYSPPMPWILVDKSGTHLLVITQLANGSFEKLILEI